MLTVTGLSAGYGAVPVLDRVELTVRAGAAMAVVGSNGMGKTTLMRALMGFLPATAGRVALDGRDLTAAPPPARARAGMGYVPQGRGVFPRMTVREQLRYARAATGRRGGEPPEILERFPALPTLLDRPGDALSGGERKLVALACSLAGEPRMLLLDEPTEGLQPALVDRLLDLLSDLKERRGLTILLTEQNLEFASKLCERAAVMRKGAIAAMLSGALLTDHADEIDDLLVGAD